MPPPRTYNDIHNTGNGISDFYQGLPVVCRTLLTCYLVTGLAWFFGILPIHLMYHEWRRSLFTFPPFAASVSFPGVHRLLLNFAIIGKPSINYLFNLVWLVNYGVSYEKAEFLGDAAAAIWMTMLGMMSSLVVDLLIPPLSGFFHGQSLIFMMIYLWSKRQGPEVTVSLFGLIKLKAMYLPFALLFIDIIQAADPTHGLRGILAGHLYWFLREVMNIRWVNDAPAWLRRATWVETLSNLGMSRSTGRATVHDNRGITGASRASGPGNSAQQAKPSTSSAGFRAFSGKGHKLS